MVEKVRRIKKVYLFIALAMLIATPIAYYGYSLMTSMVNIPNIGVYVSPNIWVCSDSAATQNLTGISWGAVRVSTAYTKQTYVKNVGNVNVTLTFMETNWNPTTAFNAMTLTTNYASQILKPGDILPIIFTLTIGSSNLGISTFSFDLRVTGSG